MVSTGVVINFEKLQGESPKQIIPGRGEFVKILLRVSEPLLFHLYNVKWRISDNLPLNYYPVFAIKV